jgi:hypothetical protein
MTHKFWPPRFSISDPFVIFTLVLLPPPMPFDLGQKQGDQMCL